jgi:hypothetical protein
LTYLDRRQTSEAAFLAEVEPAMAKFLCNINDPDSIITPIDSAVRFPEILDACHVKYQDDIALFRDLIAASRSSAELLDRIRSKSIAAASRMSLLKMFRRCVSPVLDTEKSKKITSVRTSTLVAAYGGTFKPIDVLKAQFEKLTDSEQATLAALIGEYDTRGQSGYELTGLFFDWFEKAFEGQLTITGPRGAGRDVELSTVFSDFTGSFPADFVIKTADRENAVLAVGFARYDATRGGAQSDDRTGGNLHKVTLAKEYCVRAGRQLRIIFLADGPGLSHRDTWNEACKIDGEWNGNVRVTTLKTAPERIAPAWLLGTE